MWLFGQLGPNQAKKKGVIYGTYKQTRPLDLF